MKINFAKVSRTPSDFSYRDGDLVISGTLNRDSSHLVELNGKIEGETSLICDRCGKDYKEKVNFPLSLHLSDRIISVSNDEELDIIEFLDGIIDMKSLLESEIESYRLSYHCCFECEKKGSVDIEF